MEREPHHPFVFWQIAVAVLVWAAVIALGALRDDPRRSLVLVGCALGFTLFWFTVLLVRKNRRPASTESDPPDRVSWTSATSAVIMSIGFLLFMSVKLFTPAANTIALGAQSWFILGLTLVAQVMAVVGLSDPQPRRGKLSAILAMLLFAIMVVVMIAEIALG